MFKQSFQNYSLHVWMKLQVVSDCSNLLERLRLRLFTFTLSCSGQSGLFLPTGSEWGWTGGTQVGVSV